MSKKSKKVRVAIIGVGNCASCHGRSGEGGRGSVAVAGLSQQQVPILMGTLGKALGCAGAFVAGSEALIETLKLLGSPKLPKGNRVVAAANSGGYAAMIGEKGRAVGLEFPVPSDAARQALRDDVSDLVSLLNPLDWNLPWASMARSETSDVGLGHLMTDEVDLLVYIIDWPRQKDVAIADSLGWPVRMCIVPMRVA